MRVISLRETSDWIRPKYRTIVLSAPSLASLMAVPKLSAPDLSQTKTMLKLGGILPN